jgi:hypothetical protein
MGKAPPGSVIGALRRLDAFPKVNEDFFQVRSRAAASAGVLGPARCRACATCARLRPSHPNKHASISPPQKENYIWRRDHHSGLQLHAAAFPIGNT